jgi:hypothetical protein
VKNPGLLLAFGTLTLIVGLSTIPSLIQPRAPLPSVPQGLPVASQGSSTASVAPEVPLALPEPPRPVERVLGYFVTQFKTFAQDERVHNIELGAKKLDGVVIPAGGTFSFNTVVGPRNEAGFRNAPALFLGEVTQELGGGMCQVSSTLFAAALSIGLEVVERRPHSRPSSYIQKGFDATVNFPPSCQGEKPDRAACVDLQLRNPYDFPLTIRTRTFDPVLLGLDLIQIGPKRSLGVSLIGLGPVATVTTAWKTYETPPFEQRFRRHAWLKTGKRKKQSGANGVEGALLVDVTWPDGRKDHRTMTSKYKPVDEVWEVGQDWDMEKKPWE